MKTTALTRIKAFTLLSLLLLSIAVTISFLPATKAETKIISISPASGYVGTNVTLTANVSELGLYHILFDGNEILSGDATEYNITANFNVPHAPQGVHNVTLVSANGENDTLSFTILTFQSFEPQIPEAPAQLQEGAGLTINVTITGGLANYTYPKLKVQTPRVDLNYTALDDFNVTTDVNGTCLMSITYPDSFSEGANTNFTGYYKIFFNETVVNQFFIGLTNASIYHRGDVVNVKAVDYPVNENVTITFTFGNATIHAETYNATDGTINYNWPVPNHLLVSNATHMYNVTITPVPSAKNFSDTQKFEIPGFNATIYTQNLAGKTVSNILVKLYDESASTNYTNSSGASGYAFFKLEKGNYTAEAYFKDVKVGDGLQFNITGETSLNVTFTCQLASLIINVENERGIRIPHVTINVTYNYTTNHGTPENRTGTESGQTDINGTLLLSTMLPNVTYVVNASLYGMVFNIGNNTLPDLPVADYVNATILCPTRRLNIQFLDANNQLIPSITVKAQELTVGLFVESEAVDGNVTLLCTFGKYSLKVFYGGILLNETSFDLTSSDVDINVTIKCQLYGLNIAVKVVDYFGQPISGANVVLQRNILLNSSFTDSNGLATFLGTVGGEIQITVYLSGQPCINTTAYVENSVTLTIRAAKYVVLAGFLVEASHLATIIIIMLTALFILLIEVYRRKHFERGEAQAQSQNKEQ